MSAIWRLPVLYVNFHYCHYYYYYYYGRRSHLRRSRTTLYISVYNNVQMQYYFNLTKACQEIKNNVSRHSLNVSLLKRDIAESGTLLPAKTLNVSELHQAKRTTSINTNSFEIDTSWLSSYRL